MKIEINLVAAYKLIAQKGRLSLDLPENSSVFGIIQRVVKAVPLLKSHWLEKDGSLSPHLHVFLNGDDVTTLSDGMNTHLVTGDILDFIPPLSGRSC
jgi:molybdopterin converting factor small subunit